VGPPEYHREERGPPHEREFLATVRIVVKGTAREFAGEWTTPCRRAEQSAANAAVDYLRAAGY